MAYQTCTLTGTYHRGLSNQPDEGTIEIIPNSPVIVDGAGNVILSGRRKVTLDDNGSFSVTLPATDDATLEPALNRSYTVVAKLRSTRLSPVTGVLLPSGGSVDMADVTSGVAQAAAYSSFFTEADYTDLQDRIGDLESNPAGVSSVAGKTGAVTLTPTDVGAAAAADLAAEVTRATTAEGTKVNSSTFTAHTGNTSNPHSVTKAQVGLGNVENLDTAGIAASASLSAAFAAKAAVTPQATRIGKKIALADPAAWTVGVSGTGTVTTGTDATYGDYIRLTNGTAGAAYRAGRDMAALFDGTKVISMRVRKNDANLSVLDLFLVFGAFSTQPFNQWNKGVSGLDVGVWHQIILTPAEWDTQSGPAPTDTKDLRDLLIRITPTAGNVSTVDFADFRVHEIETPAKIAFQFDDGRASTYTEAYPRLGAKGWVGGVAVEHTNVGGTNRCTLAQLQAMYASGWAIHGHHDAQLPALTEAQQVAIHQASKAWMQTNGFQRGESVWAWPGGARSAAAEAIALRYWRTCRRVSAFQQFGAAHVYEPVNPPVSYINNTTVTLAVAKARVDRAVAAGGAMVFVFHDLVSATSAPEDWLITDFQALLDYIATKNCKVVPTSEVWTH